MIELLTPEEMNAADRLAAAALGGSYPLMQSAGRAVAERALELVGADAAGILVLAGPGNNGGDGFVAAELLRRSGCRVRLALLGPADRLSGDAARAATDYGGATETLTATTDLSGDLIVDALFGAGLARPLDGVAAETVERVNASGAKVLAVDLPSGIHGATGAICGTAVRADATVTFFRLKPGHLLLPGRLHCGATSVRQIGIDPSVLAEVRPTLFHDVPALWRGRLPVPRADAHKYRRGHCVVVSGGASHTGAARLAARGALRAGAGLVTVASPPDALLVNAAQLTAIMVRPVADAAALGDLLGDRRLNAVAIGPGAGVSEATAESVLACLRSEAAVTLDADAITAFADRPGELFEAIGRRPGPVVMTPHDGEFARLFPDLTQAPGKAEKTRQAAARAGATIILKGPDTVVASPDGRAAITDNGPPWLATAGSGDVLTGIAAGLLAQGMDAFEAAAAAVWMHGEAARLFGPGLIAEDLPERLPAVLAGLYGS
ncbi:NAD(P)H-hydrate dehydratase [Faunimonas sp. B44]|uniref:NAD(P)H-hydrate dehydratase n=1 Tax=Faunimonas sp. B44 TaxID=3461493 RepID=UPI00404454C0